MKHYIVMLAALFFAVLVSCEKQEPVSSQDTNVTTNLADEDEPNPDRLDRYDDAYFGAFNKHKAVVVPAGSVDALAAAIAQAGHKGTVRLASGAHTENSTVTITFPVRILGEAGAVLYFNSDPTTIAPTLDPGFHILNTERVYIGDLEIRPIAAVGGTAILVQNSYRPRLEANAIYDFQFSILIEQGDDTRIYDNNLAATTAWQIEFFEVHAIVNVNGDRVRAEGNTITNAFFGAWMCDGNGRFEENTLYGNYIGLILCKVPENAFPLPDGSFAGSENSAYEWRVKKNNAHDNLDAGYLVIDGANENRLSHNNASNNGTYDIELVGDSYRFGFLTPTSFDNTVIAGQYPNIIIKDCGLDNDVYGGIQVDITLDPCF